jgi:hypothetical protein
MPIVEPDGPGDQRRADRLPWRSPSKRGASSPTSSGEANASSANA